MPDPRMLNGGKKGTAIVRLDHTAMLVIGGKKKEFKNLEKLLEFKVSKKIEINIEHIHPASIRTENIREWNMPLAGKGFFREMMRTLFKAPNSISQKEVHNVDNTTGNSQKSG